MMSTFLVLMAPQVIFVIACSVMCDDNNNIMMTPISGEKIEQRDKFNLVFIKICQSETMSESVNSEVERSILILAQNTLHLQFESLSIIAILELTSSKFAVFSCIFHWEHVIFVTSRLIKYSSMLISFHTFWSMQLMKNGTKSPGE